MAEILKRAQYSYVYENGDMDIYHFETHKDMIRELDTVMPTGMGYNNGQLQLKAGNNPIGLPVDIATGGAINAFLSGYNNFSFTATSAGQKTFTIPITYLSTDVVELYRANLTLVRGTDFSVSTAGVVTLVDGLDNGEVVHGTLQHTSFDANDLHNKQIFATAGHTHTATEVTQDATHRFTTDAEKEKWNNSGGKRVARFTVGTSTAGWTAFDCDYLCDGTDDQVEINAAIQALPTTGGEVVVLDGTYNITATIAVNKDNVKLSGNGNATVFKRMWNSTTGEGVITITGSYCTISDLCVKGNRDTDTGLPEEYTSVQLQITSSQETFVATTHTEYTSSQTQTTTLLRVTLATATKRVEYTPSQA